MRYRRLDTNGDYVFGQGSLDFLTDLNAVAQAVKTRLQLWEGTWWLDLNEGLPMFQQIIGSSGSPTNQNVLNGIIEGRIAGTTGVTVVTAFDSSWDSTARQFAYQANVQTVYSAEPLTVQDVVV